MVLADLGADVVKVEPPEGDATRGWGPPWVGDGESRTAAYYLAVNRNKRSIRLDLRTAAGRSVLRRLLASADVLVENGRPGAFDRFGFGDEALAEQNPRLVHLAISGYGRTGPAAVRPGYDFVAQAVGGLMSITGPAGGPATKVGVAISDIAAGLFGAIGVLAAVIGRTGGDPATGGGQRVDVSLLGATLALLINQAQNAFVNGRAPGRGGNAHPNIVPYETFPTADGEIAVAVGSERQWLRLCLALGLPALADDPRFATNGDRVDHRSELIPTLRERFEERETADWLTILDAAEIPCGPILDVLGAFEQPAAVALGARVPLDHRDLGPVDQVAPPFLLSATPASVRTPPPLAGEQTDEILAELGFEPPEIVRLRADGVS